MEKSGKGGAHLDDASTGPGGIEEMARKPEEPCTPVHHRHLEFRACGTTGPLCV